MIHALGVLEVSGLDWESSLHCIIALSIYSFSYNGVCCDALKLSICDIIVSQKGSVETESYISLGSTKFYLLSLRKNTSLGKDTVGNRLGP